MMLKLIECPRDAMQGLHEHIPAQVKAEYINLLLASGFDTIDFGSFVSPKAVPQMSDTADVLRLLNLQDKATKLLAIVANTRGIRDSMVYPEIDCLGFPFSISETFQQRNTNSSITESLKTVKFLLDCCHKTGKEAVIYLSMAFGNPYGDEWNNEIAELWTDQLASAGVKTISLADTTGMSTPEKISGLFPHLQSQFPGIEFGVHLHSKPSLSADKLEAAWESGCRRFDSALRGFGGCPMATDNLTGNIATDSLISLLEAKRVPTGLNYDKWEEAMNYSPRIFG